MLPKPPPGFRGHEGKRAQPFSRLPELESGTGLSQCHHHHELTRRGGAFAEKLQTSLPPRPPTKQRPSCRPGGARGTGSALHPALGAGTTQHKATPGAAAHTSGPTCQPLPAHPGPGRGQDSGAVMGRAQGMPAPGMTPPSGLRTGAGTLQGVLTPELSVNRTRLPGCFVQILIATSGPSAWALRL